MSEFGRYQARPGHSGARRAAQNGSLWLITFGDLLTLLLCFFLSAVSFGPLNPAAQQGAGDLTNGYDGVAADSEYSNANYGTEIASNNVRAGGLELRFGEADYSPEGVELLEPARERLKNEIVSGGYESGQVLIETCFATVAPELERSWFMSVSRALNIRSQVLDAGMAVPMQIRSVGPHCAVLDRSAGANGIAVRLRLTAGERHSG